MKESDRRAALACLAAIELNMAEAYGIEAWRSRLSDGARLGWKTMMAEVRAYQRDLQSLAPTLDQAVYADGG